MRNSPIFWFQQTTRMQNHDQVPMTPAVVISRPATSEHVVGVLGFHIDWKQDNILVPQRERFPVLHCLDLLDVTSMSEIQLRDHVHVGKHDTHTELFPRDSYSWNFWRGTTTAGSSFLYRSYRRLECRCLQHRPRTMYATRNTYRIPIDTSVSLKKLSVWVPAHR